MSDKIVDLHPVRNGDNVFLQCPCGGDFLIVVIAQENPIITGLVCQECEQEIPVTNGILGAEK